MKQILRAGSKFYRGILIPINTKTFIIKSGEECYLSGTRLENNKYISEIYVFELEKFIEVEFIKIEKYFENTTN